MERTEGLGLEITELRLGLPGGVVDASKKNEKKRLFSEIEEEDGPSSAGSDEHKRRNDDDVDESRSQVVVGWPPVCSYRKRNSLKGVIETTRRESNNNKLLVKVSMDGAPFLRKIDLGNHRAYSDLVLALDKLFGCFGIIGESFEDVDSREFVPIYEDKDGDWMLVGDVPWQMFAESCKRLRIMRRSDAAKGIGIGLHGRNIDLKLSSSSSSSSAAVHTTN